MSNEERDNQFLLQEFVIEKFFFCEWSEYLCFLYSFKAQTLCRSMKIIFLFWHKSLIMFYQFIVQLKSCVTDRYCLMLAKWLGQFLHFILHEPFQLQMLLTHKAAFVRMFTAFFNHFILFTTTWFLLLFRIRKARQELERIREESQVICILSHIFLTRPLSGSNPNLCG